MLVSFKILLSDMGVTGNALVKKLNPAKKIILKASLRAYDILATSFQGLFSVMTLHRCFFRNFARLDNSGGAILFGSRYG